MTYRYSSRDYQTLNDHVWANNKTVIIVKNDVYDIADYYHYDLVVKTVLQPTSISRFLRGAVSLSTFYGVTRDVAVVIKIIN